MLQVDSMTIIVAIGCFFGLPLVLLMIANGLGK
jgi:hypothetical protein